MSIFFNIILILFLNLSISARDLGETEITTDDGIEVYQNEKYYLLKKNVKIDSDNFILNADNVRINFKDNLNDITELDAKGSVQFNSSEFKMKGRGENLKFVLKSEKLEIEGIDSELITEDIKMYSNGSIKVNNLSGEFLLFGENSKLINESVIIIANSIDGIFTDNNDKKEISLLNVIDEKISYIKNNDTEMYAKKINFNNKNSLIELMNDVVIIRNGEKVTGDYGTLDTKNNSYKIKSNNQTKVKAIIKNNE